MIEDGSIQEIEIGKDDDPDEKKNNDDPDEKKNNDDPDEKKNNDDPDEKKNNDDPDEKNSLELDRKQTPTTQPESEQIEGQKQSPFGGNGDSKSTLVTIDSKQVTAIAECDNNKEGIFFRNKNF
jgi:hypothetical protein